jgi:hypothetical protein
MIPLIPDSEFVGETFFQGRLCAAARERVIRLIDDVNTAALAKPGYRRPGMDFEHIQPRFAAREDEHDPDAPCACGLKFPTEIAWQSDMQATSPLAYGRFKGHEAALD